MSLIYRHSFMQWPDYYPEDCPPENARPASGVVYRLIRQSHPTSKDFRSHRETQPHRTFDVPECIACGLSVFMDIEDVIRLQKRVPALRRRRVAKGTLVSDLGNMLPTPSRTGRSHHTWWVPVSTQPWELFQVAPVSRGEL